MVINTNIEAQATANNLNASQAQLAKALSRLSSGSKIIVPSDDAAGLAVSSRMRSQIKRLASALTNVVNAVSFTQTQDGFMKTVDSAFRRMGELSMLAQDTTKSNADRSLYNQEFQQLKDYVSQTAKQDFNGVSLFDGRNLDVTVDAKGTTFAMAGINLDAEVYQEAVATGAGQTTWTVTKDVWKLGTDGYLTSQDLWKDNAGKFHLSNPGSGAVFVKQGTFLKTEPIVEVTTPQITESVVTAWGRNDSGQTNVPAGLTDVTAVSGGGEFSVALKSDGTVTSWGNAPTPPAGLSDVKAVTASYGNVAALKNDGTVVLWGDNSYGQLNIPAGLNNVIQVVPSSKHMLALKSDGTVTAWGNNSHGQLNIPAGLNNVKAVSTGHNHNLAVRNDGTAVAWGENGAGQTNIPGGLTNVKAAAAGGMHSYLLREDGTLVGWGSSKGTVPSGSDFTAISADLIHTLALKSDGTVVAANGGNNYPEYDFGQSNVPAGLANVTAISAGHLFSLALSVNIITTQTTTNVSVGNAVTAGTWVDADPGTEDSLVTKYAAGSVITEDPTSIDPGAVRMDPLPNTSLETVALAQNALAKVKAAITQVATDRARLGAVQSRLNFTNEQLTVTQENLAAAVSRITDVDVADEATRYARYQILVASGTEMLKQANNLPEAALHLLK